MTYEQGMNYLIGQVMKITNGRADPVLARQYLEEIIEEIRSKRAVAQQ